MKVNKKQHYNYYTSSTPQSGVTEALATKAAEAAFVIDLNQ
jgi:hypothetical protein